MANGFSFTQEKKYIPSAQKRQTPVSGCRVAAQSRMDGGGCGIEEAGQGSQKSLRTRPQKPGTDGSLFELPAFVSIIPLNLAPSVRLTRGALRSPSIEPDGRTMILVIIYLTL